MVKYLFLYFREGFWSVLYTNNCYMILTTLCPDVSVYFLYGDGNSLGRIISFLSTHSLLTLKYTTQTSPPTNDVFSPDLIRTHPVLSENSSTGTLTRTSHPVLISRSYSRSYTPCTSVDFVVPFKSLDTRSLTDLVSDGSFSYPLNDPFNSSLVFPE